MSTLTQSTEAWHNATAALPWGVQRAFYTALELVKDGKLEMSWGADYGSDGKPCLVNSTANMLGATKGTGGTGLPSQHFGPVVSAFDRINRKLQEEGFNGDKVVSPDAASYLLRHFGDLKTVEEATQEAHAQDTSDDGPYIALRDDNEMLTSWLNANTQPAPAETSDAKQFEQAVQEDLNKL
jgi:hypothetical protein